MEWLAGRVTDVFLTVSERGGGGRAAPGHRPPGHGVGNGRDPARFHPDPAARARIRAELGVPADRVVIVAVSRLVRHKGYAELLAAMERVPGAELWVVGERLASDRGADLAPRWTAPPRRAGCAAWATAPTSRPCWPPPTSSACRAISRACRCR